MDNRIRAQIRLDTQQKILDFTNCLNNEVGRYSVEDVSGERRVDARSLLGLIYASGDFGDEMYLVNETDNGYFPNFVNNYRV